MERPQGWWQDAIRTYHVAFEAALTPLVCFFAGWWLDGRFGTGIWLRLAGFFVGLAVGFYRLAVEISRGAR